MGTIAEKGEYLNNTKLLLKQKINNLGGEIDDNTTFRQYANQLQNVYDNLPKTSYAEGSNITLSNTLKGKLDFEDGIVGIGDTYQYSTTGKNLFNPSVSGLFASGCTASLNGDEVSINATQNGDIYVGNVRASGGSYATDKGVKIPVAPLTSYILSLTNSNVNKLFITEYDSNNISLGYVQANTITTQANTSYITIRYGLENAVNGTTYKTKIQVEKGSTATTYEPYTNGASPNPSYPQDIEVVTGTQTVYIKDENNNIIDTKTINLGEYEFAKIGNYVDTIEYDVENDKVYKNEYIGKLVLNGSENFTKSSLQPSQGTKFYLSTNIPNAKYTDGNPYVIGSALSNYLKDFLQTDYNNGTKEGFLIAQNGLNFMIENITLENFIIKLQQNNMYVYYITNGLTKKEITITLADQIKALYNSHSFTGTTIIEIDGQLPLIIKVRALKGN